MKELLIIILTLLLMSCNTRCDKCNHEPVIIFKTRSSHNNSMCYYDYKGLGKEYNMSNFEDSCNKYNIGDTIK